MERYPDEWERFLADPYAHRAPRAESYHDLSGMSPCFPNPFLSVEFLLISVRLEPIIFELERVQEDMLVIGHASVIRCLVRHPLFTV
jgi:6-phosphofructo-2-kinase/fructose-2,6-biphosphatase 4